jgi:hypothetical protein
MRGEVGRNYGTTLGRDDHFLKSPSSSAAKTLELTVAMPLNVRASAVNLILDFRDLVHSFKSHFKTAKHKKFRSA